MSLSLLFQSISTAFSMGLGCGSCCGTSMSIFLTSYIMTHAKDLKKTIFAFLNFFIGKLAAIAMVCILASLLGNKIISEDGYIGKVNVHLAMQLGILLLGIILIVMWIREHIKEKSCKSCGGKCSSETEKEQTKQEKMKNWPTLLIGFIYGITPCAPLLMMAGYSITMPVYGAFIIALAFCIASTISPALLLVLLAGVLSKKMYEEIPKYIDYMKLSCYILFIIMALVNIF